MERIGIAHLTATQVGTLAHAQRQLVELATVIAPRPALILLDEPAAGMNGSEVEGLGDLLVELARSCSVIVVEHNQAVMAHADWIIDLGPGAGHDGGRIVFEGTPSDLAKAETLTGRHLATYLNG